MTTLQTLSLVFLFLAVVSVAAVKIAEHNRFMRELEIRQRMYRERMKKLSKLP